MTDKLRQFYKDEEMRNDVAQHMAEVMNEEIIDRAYAGKSVEHIPLVEKIVNRFYSSLEKQFGERVEEKPPTDRSV